MKFFFVLAFAIASLNAASALSCYLGRAGCYASCQLQNCATGYCDSYGGTCRCSRCANGGIVTVDVSVSVGGGKGRSLDHTVIVSENVGSIPFCAAADGDFGNATIVIGLEVVPGTASSMPSFTFSEGTCYQEKKDYDPAMEGFFITLNNFRKSSCACLTIMNDTEVESTEHFSVHVHVPERISGEPEFATVDKHPWNVAILGNGAGSLMSNTLMLVLSGVLVAYIGLSW